MPFDAVSMEEGEDWLFRPVRAQMCLYKDLVTPGYTLEDIELMNEALDVEAENTYRANLANQKR